MGRRGNEGAGEQPISITKKIGKGKKEREQIKRDVGETVDKKNITRLY